MKRFNITPEQFVVAYARAYHAGQSLDAVVAKLSKMAGEKVTKHYVVARASYYRSLGVTIKPFSERDRQKNAA